MQYFHRARLAWLLAFVSILGVGSAVAASKYPPLGSFKACQAYSGLPTGDDKTEQIWVPGGSFIMGSDTDYSEESKAHKVTVSGFWIDRHDVTNAQFRKFVVATGYLTLAERGLDPKRYPGLPGEMYQPGSTVFVPPKKLMISNMQWWHFIPGANWKHPTGPNSSNRGLDNHPVVHIAYEDALAYAKWQGHELPTEAEFEYAAKGGSTTTFPWGKTLTLHGKQMTNTWQGAFPFQNTTDDGFVASAPVGCFPPNRFGLYDMVGNVWEWVSDRWTAHHPAEEQLNPQVDLEDALVKASRTPQLGVIKGGSFLCSPMYCKRYRPSARHAQDLTMGTNHIGFRTILRGPGPATR